MGIPTWLKKVATELGVDITITVEKGWIRETVFYDVTGSAEALTQFNQVLALASQRYNGQD